MQLVSVNRGHCHLVCVFYKLLADCSQWEGGSAALDPSPGVRPALYLILSQCTNSHRLALTSPSIHAQISSAAVRALSAHTPKAMSSSTRQSLLPIRTIWGMTNIFFHLVCNKINCSGCFSQSTGRESHQNLVNSASSVCRAGRAGCLFCYRSFYVC